LFIDASAYCWITWYGHHVLVPTYQDRPRCWQRWGRLYLLYLLPPVGVEIVLRRHAADVRRLANGAR
jgi:hypothetical protein